MFAKYGLFDRARAVVRFIVVRPYSRMFVSRSMIPSFNPASAA
jgi:hypothetical protein